MSGTVTITEELWGKAPTMTWSARRPATDKPASPRTLDFEPKQFHRVFSSTIEPVLRIWPGDTVRTWTVDAGGVDAAGKSRVLGGNPQTGPFYVEGAMPGDVLAVHVKKLTLNRPSAISGNGLVDRAPTNDYAAEHKDDAFQPVVWELDLAKESARPAKASEKLKNLEVPVKPMLGCIAVAPRFGGAAIQTGDSGRIGGNMDFNEIVEGATVYLPVGQPGALLYVGDGHAVQGTESSTATRSRPRSTSSSRSTWSGAACGWCGRASRTTSTSWRWAWPARSTRRSARRRRAWRPGSRRTTA